MEIEPNYKIKNSSSIIRYINHTINNFQDVAEFISNICVPCTKLKIMYETSKSLILQTSDERLVIKFYTERHGTVIHEGSISSELAAMRSDLFPTILGTFHNAKIGIIVSKYVGVDSFEILSSDNNRATELTQSFCAGLVSAVDIVHQQGWTHRDIKLENVVYCETDQRWRLIDFGLATKHDCPARIAGTPPFFIPHDDTKTLTHTHRVESDMFASAMAILSFAGVICPQTKFCAQCIYNKKNSLCFRLGKCNDPRLYRINLEWINDLANEKYILPPRISKLTNHIKLSAAVVRAALYPYRFYKYLAWDCKTLKWDFLLKNDERSFSNTSDVYGAWERLRLLVKY